MNRAILSLLAVGMFTTAARSAEPGPLAGAVIVVDPGHGGQLYSKNYTGGTRGTTSKLTESDLNLRVGLELAKILKENGATVFVTRDSDHRLSPEGSERRDELHARTDFFDTYNPHFFLSVHHNAGGAKSTGHTALFKPNAADDAMYESLARAVNDALEGVVPGPKLKLLKQGNHVLESTPIPGMISEAGFMTNKEFDDLSNAPGYPNTEATAIAKGAIKYWTEHKPALIALRAKQAEEQAARPRDPKTFTAIELNPAYREKMAKLLEQVAPGGQYDPAKANDYIAKLKSAIVTDPAAKFDVKADYDGKRITLTGSTSDRKYHDQIINMFVAMKLYNLTNKIETPKTAKP